MKLVDAIIMGRFMGLQTVQECVDNYYLHYLHFLPFDQVTADQEELELDYTKYENNELDLDWDYINQQVEKQNKEFENYCEENPPVPFELPEDWRKG